MALIQTGHLTDLELFIIKQLLCYGLGKLKRYPAIVQLYTSNDFNDPFLANPHKIVANIASSEPATKFVEKFFENKTIPPLKFSLVMQS